MKASEIIDALEDLIQTHGDQEVFMMVEGDDITIEDVRYSPRLQAILIQND